MPAGDVIDRYTIVLLKRRAHYAEHSSEFTPFDDENGVLFAEIKRLKNRFGNELIDSWIVKMTAINQEIWGYESDLRNGREHKYQVDCPPTISGSPEDVKSLLSLAAVGQAAINIRNTNKRRIELRNLISTATKTGFADVKIAHASS